MMFKISISIFVLLYILTMLSIRMVAPRIMFLPHLPSYANQPPVFKINVAPGKTIAAIYLTPKNPKFTILFSHGNAEDIGHIRPLLQAYAKHGYAVLAYDYEGYGRSDGLPSEANCYRDIKAAYEFLTENMRIPTEQIVVYGRSIGSGPSVELAMHHKIAALILEAPFTSVLRVVTSWQIFPFDYFNNIQKIAKITAPIMIIHGKSDRIIPIRLGKQLFNAINPKVYKQMWSVPRAGHNNLHAVAGATYWQKIHEFLSHIIIPAKPKTKTANLDKTVQDFLPINNPNNLIAHDTPHRTKIYQLPLYRTQ